jgi:hypothetical protein
MFNTHQRENMTLSDHQQRRKRGEEERRRRRIKQQT